MLEQCRKYIEGRGEPLDKQFARTCDAVQVGWGFRLRVAGRFRELHRI